VFALGFPEIVILFIVAAIIFLPISATWMIFQKAGFPGWWSLSYLLGPLWLVALLYVAYAEWPVERRLSELKDGSSEDADPITTH